MSPADHLDAMQDEAVRLAVMRRSRRLQERHGQGRGTVEAFPFGDHLTLAELAAIAATETENSS